MSERSIDVSNKRFIIAGGGTGGHVFPALAIANAIKELQPDARILFIGTKDKLEADVVPKHGYEFRPIWISGLHRKRILKNVLFPIKVMVATVQAFSIVKNFNPAVVVGTGGYVSGPALRAATIAGFPTVVVEQNSCPGVTTLMLKRKAKEIYIAFEQTKKYLKRTDSVFLLGNPTRDSLENINATDAYSYFGFKQHDKKKTVLIFGGSLGAHRINEAVTKAFEKMMQSGFRIIWQTGKNDLDEARKICLRYTSSVWVDAFIDRMDYAYTVADLVVSRAGATTIAELTRLGKPAVLIPYPHAAANHQLYNAMELVNAGAAKLLLDSEAVDQFPEVVVPLLAEEGALSRMSEASKRLGKPRAAQDIAKRILSLAEKQETHW